MSRARAVRERRPGEGYMTPPGLARAVVRAVRSLVIAPTDIIEPSCGTGAFIRAAREAWPNACIFAVDTDRRHARAAYAAGADAFSPMRWESFAPRFAKASRNDPPKSTRLVIGNPPFSKAVEHIELALDAVRPHDSVVMLLRTNLLGSHARVRFWDKYPPLYVFPVVPRPSFTGGGSDSTEYAVFLWRKDAPSIAGLLMRPLVWKPKAGGQR